MPRKNDEQRFAKGYLIERDGKVVRVHDMMDEGHFLQPCVYFRAHETVQEAERDYAWVVGRATCVGKGAQPSFGQTMSQANANLQRYYKRK